MDDRVKKSIVVMVSRDLWKRFKSRTALRDRKIGALVEEWIRKYVEDGGS